jgi:hypothetical protein
MVSPNHFMRVLKTVMDKTHDRVSIYHRRYKFTLGVGVRYNSWPSTDSGGAPLPAILNILSASYLERPLGIILPLQYPGPTGSDENWPMSYGEPKKLWLDVLPSSVGPMGVAIGPIRIGVDPVPPTGARYVVHAMMSIPLPDYTNWLQPLPTTEQSHGVISNGVLAKFYDIGKTFHENNQKRMHVAAYEAGVQSLIPLIQRNERQPSMGATSARYVTASL